MDKQIDDAQLAQQLLNDPFARASSHPGAQEVLGGRFPKAPRSVARAVWPFHEAKPAPAAPITLLGWPF
jgi:hypothetical protein